MPRNKRLKNWELVPSSELSARIPPFLLPLTRSGGGHHDVDKTGQNLVSRQNMAGRNKAARHIIWSAADKTRHRFGQNRFGRIGADTMVLSGDCPV